jgi:hypothetical protein
MGKGGADIRRPGRWAVVALIEGLINAQPCDAVASFEDTSRSGSFECCLKCVGRKYAAHSFVLSSLSCVTENLPCHVRDQ